MRCGKRGDRFRKLSGTVSIGPLGRPQGGRGAPQVVKSVALDGTAMTIAFTKTLGASSSLANSAFTVKKTPAGGSEETVSLTGSPSISGDTVTLNFGE